MIAAYIYKVAEFSFSVQLEEGKEIDEILTSFIPFKSKGTGTMLFQVEAFHAALPTHGDEVLWEETRNDMGLCRLYKSTGGYRITFRYSDDGAEHVMVTDDRFGNIKAAIEWQDRYAGNVLCSMIRVAYSQAVVYHSAVSVHASAVCAGGRGFLFMGKSGTGKSTHSALWVREFEGCELLNDDNPVICLDGEGAMVYGTPWSGKTPCYRNAGCRLEGIARLQQAKTNRFVAKNGVGAFIAVLPGCSVIRKDTAQYNALCATLVKLVEATKVGVMECLPDKEAAAICREGLEMNGN